MRATINDILSKKVLLLDGAMGTMIQHERLTKAQYHGERFVQWDKDLTGCNDVLVITQPHIIKKIHESYLNAGADIIETDSFNSNAISMLEYGLSDNIEEINREAAKLAREVVDDWMVGHPNDTKFVAGSVGPTNISLSLQDANTVATGWNNLMNAYVAQMKSLIQGGVDVLLIETVFDTLNAKCAVVSAMKATKEVNANVPIMLSVTLTENGRTLSGQTLEAFVASMSEYPLLSLGLNCGFGAEGMVPFVKELVDVSPFPVSIYPNAGLPNELGEYDESPSNMIAHLKQLFDNNMINIVGGCCGTTPAHIAALLEYVEKVKPLAIKENKNELVLSGLEPLKVSREMNFINIGERCNVAGSRKFLRLIKEENYDEALSIARKQIEDGAQIIDINMDDAMLDAPDEMEKFVKLCANDADIAKVPFMIDSSNWNVIERVLPLLQGKGIVNSISLKEGETQFCEHAQFIKNMGQAMVVMAFDEDGQATSFERKIEICERAYNILTAKIGVAPENIIFDPNVLSVATGIEEHNYYALNFIRAIEWIKTNLPYAKVSGGISNLSFSFRGNNYVREAMHSIFLFHALSVGMDMAIVNAGNILPYDDIPEDLKTTIEAAFFNPSEDATNALIEMAQKYSTSTLKKDETEDKSVEELTIQQRLIKSVMRGDVSSLEQLVTSCMDEGMTAIHVIDGPLMDAMNQVGDLFGAGKLFLPQVVKSARAMKEAVRYLNPYLLKEVTSSSNSQPTVVIATVKGDVHDIGKNIVALILHCNGFNVIDLGTMVPPEKILDAAVENNADIIGLSGLITPSLDEMCKVAEMMQQRGMTIPLFVGGAATGELHTAIKIAPCYDGMVVYTHDASILPKVAKELLRDTQQFKVRLQERQDKLRSEHQEIKNLISYDEAFSRRLQLDWNGYTPFMPKSAGSNILELPIKEIEKYINWRPFFIAWKLNPNLCEIDAIGSCCQKKAKWLANQKQADIPQAAQALQLYKEAKRAIDYLAKVAHDSVKAEYAFHNVHSEGDIVRFNDTDLSIPMLRQQRRDMDSTMSLADFISPENDIIATFAVTVGEQIQNIIERKREAGDDYGALLYQTVADRIVEGATEYFHKIMRNEIWGYVREDFSVVDLLHETYEGIRPAVGYPSIPDQSVIFDINRIMPLDKIGIEVTENGAMRPNASVCGFMIANPQSKYFNVGPISNEQKRIYASRRGIKSEDINKWLPK